MADFGLSRRIDEASNIQSKIRGVTPYIDPKRYDKEKGKGALQRLKLSDVYSIGVLFWELSSGRLPFENRDYDLDLVMDIAQGLREKPVPDTPNDYIKLYTGKLIKMLLKFYCIITYILKPFIIECWDGEPILSIIIK